MAGTGGLRQWPARGWRWGALAAVVAVVGVGCGEEDAPVVGTGTTTTVLGAATTTVAPAVTTTTTGATVGTASTSLGVVLADSAGRALYTFDRDSAGTSACDGTCAQTWPPVVVAAGAGAPTAGSGVSGTLATLTRP
ncbi:MAG: hypothetical protein ACRD0F_10610, partial [Acidimicrobiales bacterium]